MMCSIPRRIFVASKAPGASHPGSLRCALWLLGAAFLILGAAAPALGRSFFNRESPQLWSDRGAGEAQLAAIPDFAALAKQIVPAVVSLQVEQQVKAQSRSTPLGLPNDLPFDFFFRFFGEEMPREYRNRGLGTAFFISKEGLLLTNYHVVENASKIEVTWRNASGAEEKVLAKVLGTAPDYDVALLQTTEPLAAQIAYLGDSDSTQIGEWVMAVGNPFGLSHSVSVGIISARERHDIEPSGRSGLYNFLQTDASINPGNSGGPLVNMQGGVIGINTAINAAGAGIGFAIPINMVKEILPDLKNKGRYQRSWLGVTLQELNSQLARSYGLKNKEGALVTHVSSDSPAAKAGLQEGDIILTFNGKSIDGSSDLRLKVSMAGAGKVVTLGLWRGKALKTIKVTLEPFPEQLSDASPQRSGESGQSALGLQLLPITPLLQQKLNLEQREGLLVRAVDPDSPAAAAGIAPGDVLLAIGETPIKGIPDLEAALRKVSKDEFIRLKISRRGMTSFVAVARSKNE